MEWTATDIALVVSTSATAITALSSVAIPLWTGMSERRHNRREDRYVKVADAMFTCIGSIEQVCRHRSYEAMRHAFLKDGKPIPDKDDQKEGQRLQDEFGRSFRVIQMMSAELEIPFEKLNLHKATALAAHPNYVVNEGKLTQVEDETDYIAVRNRELDGFVAEAATLLSEFRTRLRLDKR